MIKNYFKIAWRNLLKDKSYSILNVLGLAVGLTCFAFVSIWVSDELSYDQFNKKADRIYRVTGHIITQAESFKHAVTPVPMAAGLKNHFPEVEQTVRFDKSDAIVKNGDLQFSEDGILATDPSFFDVFSYSLMQGNQREALNAAYNIVLTESMAKKYFGNENPIGKTLKIYLYDPSGQGKLYNVTGVIADPPKNAHFTFNFLISFKTIQVNDPDSVTPKGWDNNSYYTYLLLKDKNDHVNVEAGLDGFLAKYRPQGGGSPKDKNLAELQPLKDIHLKSNLRYEIGPVGNMKYLYIFISIGLFILLIAAINYMNLATARSLNRAKEVGVKKVLGASKGHLIGQHITESILVAMVAFLVSMAMVSLLQPLFAQLSGKENYLFSNPNLIAFLFLTTMAVGFLSGVYPAFVITAFNPSDALKGSFKSRASGVILRKGLVVAQFSIAIALIAGILIINNQLKFIQQKDLGFNKEGLIALRVNGNAEVMNNFDAFKNDLLQKSTILGVARSNSMIIGGLGNSGARTVDGEGDPLSTGTYRLRIDSEYLDVYGMEMESGRKFYKDFPADSLSYIVNEAAVQAFGWKDAENAINKPFEMAGRSGKVVGVVKNFNFNTLQHPIEPLVLIAMRRNFSQITVQANLTDPQSTLADISSTWEKHFPGAILEEAFVDEKLNNQYQAEERYSTFFLYFSILALFIACLGLLGLTAFATQQRVKEIGIRKVLGASATNITAMLSYDFIKLVILANVIAIPMAWLLMNNWLQDFEYRVNMAWWNFAIAGMIAFLIAIFTISYQALKAAMRNPIKSLRTE